jgi:hypothetical protein
METEIINPPGLLLLRKPFPDHQISKLPKPTRQQTEIVKADFKKGIRCQICGTRHHPDVVHLDYVGHAALTDRLLDADVNWTWEPLAYTPEGLPLFDKTGGLWIKLTICGVTRLGYGHAADSSFKEIGSREKEVIGDALRNAGMRFGAALDLWHKGDLHKDAENMQEQEVVSKTVHPGVALGHVSTVVLPKNVTAFNIKTEPDDIDHPLWAPEQEPTTLELLVDLVETKNIPHDQVKDMIRRVNDGVLVKSSELSDEQLKMLIQFLKLSK